MSIPVGKLVKHNMHLRVDDRLPSVSNNAYRYARMVDLWSHMHPLRSLVEDHVKAKEDDD